MAKNIKITPSVGKIEYIGNTLLPGSTTTSFVVDAGGNLSVSPAGAANAYILGLGIDPAVLLGTANQLSLTYGGANGHVTIGFPNTVVFPGNAQVSIAPVSANDLVNKAYFDANSNKRLTVRATSATNVSVSSASASMDGLTLANGDRVLLTGQTNQVENGIYVFASAGSALTRSTDFSSWSQITGALVTVQQGSSFGGTLWMSTVLNSGTVGSTAITFKRVDSASGVPSNAGVVHTDGFVFTASKIVDADVNDVAWNKITGVPGTITTQTLQSVTQNGNSTNQAINLLSTGVPATPASGITLFSDTNSFFGWVSVDSFFRRFNGTLSDNRSYTLPDASGTIVLTAATQTLTNKTLVAPTINVSSDAQGDIYYRGASGSLVNLPIGASNRILAAGVGQPFWTNSIPWSFITSSPTTLSGYGITDPILLKTGGTMTGNLILNSDPTLALQAATKNYVDMLAQGLAWKNPAKVSTGGTPLPSYTASEGFTVLTATANSALPAQDGVTLIAGDELLVMDETSGNAVNNGSYVVTQVGSGGTPWILTRSSDADTGSELVGATYYIQNGTNRGNRIYTMNTAGPITLGTSSINFVQIAGVGTYTNGSGLSLVGNVFSITTGGVTNSMLANPSINLAITNVSGSTPTWTAGSVALGGTATLNLTFASATQAGILSAADWSLFNSKAPGNNAYVQGGNSFGTVGALGTSDAFDMSFISGGVEALRINNVTRNVLIGTTTDNAAQKLQVLGSAIIAGSSDATELIIRLASAQSSLTPMLSFQSSNGAVTFAGVYVNSTSLFFNTRSSTNFTGSSNAAFGQLAMFNSTSGSNNSAFGFQALTSLTSGNQNVALGSSALQALTIGSDNISIGASAGYGMISGIQNISIGSQALFQNTTGINNVMIGYQAGFQVTGSGNIMIGGSSGSTLTSVSNRLIIDNSGTATPLVYGEFDNRIAILNAYSTIAAPALSGSSITSAFKVTQSWNTTGVTTLIYANATATTFGAGSLLMNLTVNAATKFSVNATGAIFAASNATINGAIFLLTSTSAGVGTIYKNNVPYVSSYNGSGTQDRNIFVGYNSGNLTNTSVGFNASLGYQTLKALTTGSENTALGSNALPLLTTGSNNVAVGSLALQKLTTGGNNIAIGENALGNLVSGNGNVVIGHQAGLNSVGTNNVFIGFNAGINETGSNLLYISNSSTTTPLIWGDFANYIARANGQLQVNAVLDNDAVIITAAIFRSNASKIIKVQDFSSNELFSITGDSTNIMFGYQAGSANYSGQYNVGIGYNSLHALTNGSDNVGLGRGTLQALTTGIVNTVIGSQAGMALTIATGNTVLGSAAMQSATTASSNVAIGNQAMQVGNGSSNVMIGFSTGANITGSGNVMIGANVANFGSGNNLSNRLYIDNSNVTAPLIYGEFDNRKVTLNALTTIASPQQGGSSANSALTLTQTWNTTGTPSLINVTVTDTASNAASKLINVLVNTSAILTVSKGGNTFIKGNLTVDTMAAPVNSYQYVVWDTVTHTYGVVSGSGSGSGLTAANNGLSIPTAGTVTLGQATNATSGGAQLLANTYVPFNNFDLTFVGSTTTEFLTLRKNKILLQANSGNQITLATNVGASITLSDSSANIPTVLFTNTAGANGSVQIQNAAGLFQIVESTQASGFVYDAINFRFGIKTLSPAYDFHVAGNVGIVQSLTGSSALSALTITETWNTTGTPTAFLLNLTKTAANAASNIVNIVQDSISRFAIQVDAGQTLFSANGIRLQASGGNPGGISLNASLPIGNSIIVSQGFLISQSNTIGSGAGVNIFTFDPGTGAANASGTLNYLSVIPSGSFAPTSGSAVMNAFNLQFTVNQTGTASGITRGIYINPTLTAAIDFRALEITNGMMVIKGFASATQRLSGNQTLNTGSMNWIFTGSSTATWTLPDIGSPDGTMIYIKNRGTAVLTVNVPGGGQIYDSAAVSSIDIQPGDAYLFVNDTVYWNAE